jgi:hypothetical protein
MEGNSPMIEKAMPGPELDVVSLVQTMSIPNTSMSPKFRRSSCLYPIFAVTIVSPNEPAQSPKVHTQNCSIICARQPLRDPRQ